VEPLPVDKTLRVLVLEIKSLQEQIQETVALVGCVMTAISHEQALSRERIADRLGAMAEDCAESERLRQMLEAFAAKVR
jgi:hypothetical protein